MLVGWVSVLPGADAGEDEAEDDAERPDVCWVRVVSVNVFLLRRNALCLGVSGVLVGYENGQELTWRLEWFASCAEARTSLSVNGRQAEVREDHTLMVER